MRLMHEARLLGVHSQSKTAVVEREDTTQENHDVFVAPSQLTVNAFTILLNSSHTTKITTCQHWMSTSDALIELSNDERPYFKCQEMLQ